MSARSSRSIRLGAAQSNWFASDTPDAPPMRTAHGSVEDRPLAATESCRGCRGANLPARLCPCATR